MMSQFAEPPHALPVVVERSTTVFLDADHHSRWGPQTPEDALPVNHDWRKHWPTLQVQIAERERVLLALGFDGILSPTVARPTEATLPAETRELLAKLAASRRVAIAFLSGRSLRDIQARVGLPDAFYVGNHGMEIRGPGLASSDGLAASCRSDLVDALAFLTRCTKRLRGVFIEDKGLAVTLHWRLADPRNAAALRELMEVIVRNHPRLRIFTGEACWELRARASWHKGDALRQILAHLQLQSADTIFIGDEMTDEDAFLHLSTGLTFCVGDSATAPARYRLGPPAETAAFLSRVLCTVNGRHLT